MRNFKALWSLCFIAGLFMSSCTKDGAGGSTISSQVTGTFMSSEATITVDNEVIVDGTDYMIRITEVDANTISVISDHVKTFEVDLVKSDNGEVNTGTASSANSGFNFIYQVAEGTITIDYANDDVTMKYVGEKE